MGRGTIPPGRGRLRSRPCLFPLVLSLGSLILAAGGLVRALDFWAARAPRDGRASLTIADLSPSGDAAPAALPATLRKTAALLGVESFPVLASSILAAFFLSPPQAVILSLTAGSGLLLQAGAFWAAGLPGLAAVLLLSGATLDWGGLLLIHLLLLSRYWSRSFPFPPSKPHPT